MPLLCYYYDHYSHMSVYKCCCWCNCDYHLCCIFVIVNAEMYSFASFIFTSVAYGFVSHELWLMRL